MELEIKGHEAQSSSKLKDAQAVAAYASAIKSLADADAAVGAQHLAWLDKVLKAHEIEVDAAMAPTKGADGSSKPAGRRRRRLIWRIRSCRGNRTTFSRRFPRRTICRARRRAILMETTGWIRIASSLPIMQRRGRCDQGTVQSLEA
jgi:hypothetical protein